jgi:hypothetical protein
MSPDRRYWFPAKRYGWGWGPPTCWQGWAVIAVFVALLIVGALVFLPAGGLESYLAYVTVLCGLLVAVCWLKGEPPRWRWGE